MAREHRFTSAAAALETFRRGGSGARWEASAEYLVRNANHDTRMLLDYVIERTRKSPASAGGGRRRSPWLVIGIISGVALLAAFIILFVYLFQRLAC
jgi:hypothetical protein